MGESYYEILAVDPDATRSEIESAYRERVLETHPDHSDDPDAAERFQRVTTAKSVLTDGAERARYDRLGHEAYVGLARGPGGADSSGGKATGANDSSSSGADADRSASAARRTNAESSATGTATGGSPTGNEGPTASGRRQSGRSSETRTSNRARRGAGTGAGARTGSHHARQRSHRQRQRKRQRATDGWPFDGDRSSGSQTSSSEATAGSRGSTDADDEGGFRYAVHDWDGTVDLEWEGQPIDGTTAVSVASIALLYPMLVVASLAPMFSPLVNGIVAACTLLLVGYLLTMPRLAMATFGGWSVLFPVGMVGFSLVDPLSLLGLLALGFVWVPFGYAVALWWVLRP